MNIYDLNFQSEVTRMIELEKVMDKEVFLPKPLKETSKRSLYDAGVQNELSFAPYSDRLDYIERFLYHYETRLDLCSEPSKDLKHIIHHHFTVPTDCIIRLGNVDFKDIRKDYKLIDISLIIDTNTNMFRMFFSAKGNVHMFTYTLDDIQNVIEYLLSLQLDLWVSRSYMAHSLRKLWMYQVKEELKKAENKSHIISSDDLKNIIKSISEDLTEDNHLENIRISYRELFNFFKELREENITEKTRKVQEWMTFTNDSDINKYLTSHVNYDKIKNIKEVKGQEIEELISSLKSDKRLGKKIGKVYKINEKKEPVKGNKIFTGVHGTPNKSLFSILLNGLKTSEELRKEKNKKFSYTGSGLGNGVYFAQLYQSSKSANYTSSMSDSVYLIIADVEYNEDKKLSVKSYDSSIKTKDYSLVHGVKVGSRDLDEVVAPFSDKINIRYIVELKN